MILLPLLYCLLDDVDKALSADISILLGIVFCGLPEHVFNHWIAACGDEFIDDVDSSALNACHQGSNSAIGLRFDINVLLDEHPQCL